MWDEGLRWREVLKVEVGIPMWRCGEKVSEFDGRDGAGAVIIDVSWGQLNGGVPEG